MPWTLIPNKIYGCRYFLPFCGGLSTLQMLSFDGGHLRIFTRSHLFFLFLPVPLASYLRSHREIWWCKTFALCFLLRVLGFQVLCLGL